LRFAFDNGEHTAFAVEVGEQGEELDVDERQIAREHDDVRRAGQRQRVRAGKHGGEWSGAGRILAHTRKTARAVADFEDGIAHRRQDARAVHGIRLAAHAQLRLVASHTTACTAGEEHARAHDRYEVAESVSASGRSE
jgi:hypothetical protein